MGERDKGRKFIKGGRKDQKGRSKTASLFAETITDYLEYQESTLQLLERNSDFGKTVGYKVSISKSIVFLHISRKYLENEIKDQFYLQSYQVKIEDLGISSSKDV